MKRDERLASLLAELGEMGSETAREGLTRFGIKTDKAIGVSVKDLRKLASRLGRDHDLALDLWGTGIHEARLLACFVAEPARVTGAQLEAWAADFDSWDLCDTACFSLFDRTAHAWPKAVEWAAREEEWVKRGGFALMAGLAMHDKAAPDEEFCELLPSIEAGAPDARGFVKKAASWALRNIGKKNHQLNKEALGCAERILVAANARAGGETGGDGEARAARWVAKDVLKELRSEKVQARVAAKG